MNVRLVVTLLARVILLAAACCLFWSALPTIWGWQATTVMSDSMAPGVRAGDIVVAMPVANPESALGHVVLVDDPDHLGRYRLHRLVGLTADGSLITRGDANGADDSTPVPSDGLHGIAVMRVPALGMPFVWMRSGHWELLLGAVIVTVGLCLLAARRGGTHRVEPTGRATLLFPSALALLAAMTIVTVVGSSAAQAAFSKQSPNPLSSLSTASSYGCQVQSALDAPDVMYALNEASGTAALDSSANAATGTILSNATRVAGTCSNSPALALDGTVNSGITLPGAAVSPSDTFSLEIWFSTTSTGGGELIGFGDLASGLSNVADRRIWMTTGGVLSFSIRDVNQVRTIGTPAAYNDGVWHHAIATLSASGMSLYVDGSLRVSNASFTTGYSYNPYGKHGYWRVGGDTTTGMSGVTNATLVATIDDAAVYSTTALTATQVTAHYSAGR